MELLVGIISKFANLILERKQAIKNDRVWPEDSLGAHC